MNKSIVYNPQARKPSQLVLDMREAEKRMPDEEWDELFHCVHFQEDMYYRYELPRVREKMREWVAEIKTQEPEFVKNARLGFYETRANELYERYLELEELRRKHPDFFLFETELETTKRNIMKYVKGHKILSSGNQSINGYSEELIDQCREVRLETLEPFNGKKSKIGELNKFCCPFHLERTPSFFVYPDNSYHCFGCGAHGANAIDFVMHYKQLPFNQTVKILKERT